MSIFSKLCKVPGAVVLGLCFLLFSWSFALGDAQPFKIGLVVCASGPCAGTGDYTRKGAELAASEINAAGGVLGRQIVFVMQDTRESVSGAEAVMAFRQMRTDKSIQYFVGPSWAPGGLSLAPVAAVEPDVIMMSPTVGVAAFNEAGDNLFNIWPHDDLGTRALARYALSKGWKKVAILSSQQPWCEQQGRIFADELKKDGGEITTLQESMADATDVTRETLQIAKSKPDAVYISNYLMMGHGSLKLRSFNYKGPIITSLMDSAQLGLAKGALEGALYAGYAGANADFEKKYEAKFGEKPGMGSDTGYDAVRLFARSIEEAKTFDPLLVKKVLLKQQFDGAAGKIVFDDKGGVKKTPVLYRVRGLDSEIVGPLQ